MKKILFIIFILLSFNLVYCATITGTVYDSSLNKVSKAIVEISPPLQRYITENGSYTFHVPKGQYNITVYYIEQTKKEITTEQIIITEDNQEYVFDLFLFLDLTEEEGLSEIPDINVDSITKKSYVTEILIFGFLIFFFLLIFLLKESKEDKSKIKDENLEIKDDLEKDHKNEILNILKKNQGSITQKELRKQIPYSEAKVSLWITELEYEEKVKKIKKGRGNIISLK
jgi:uncharacterized membrane protein